MQKVKKLFVTSLAIVASVFSASICAFGAQIDSLSMIGNTIYAETTAENSRLYAVEYSKEGLLSDVFFAASDEDGKIKLPIGTASEYRLFLWGKDSLAPVSVAYKLSNRLAYLDGETTPIPEYTKFPPKVSVSASPEAASYTFDQEDDVMIVTSVSKDAITGVKGGADVSYNLTDSIAVVGLSDDFSHVVPGSVVLIGINDAGDCAAIELLATMGNPVNPDNFKVNYGIYNAADGSAKYKNVVTEMYSKANNKLRTYNLPDTSKTTYTLPSDSVIYSVGFVNDGDTCKVEVTPGTVSNSFLSTAKYFHYLYLRYNSETGKVKDCIVYRFDKDLDFRDEDYPLRPFSLEQAFIKE